MKTTYVNLTKLLLTEVFYVRRWDRANTSSKRFFIKIAWAHNPYTFCLVRRLYVACNRYRDMFHRAYVIIKSMFANTMWSGRSALFVFLIYVLFIFHSTTSDPFSLPVKNTTSSLELTSYSPMKHRAQAGLGEMGRAFFWDWMNFHFSKRSSFL